jgi:hypothetical protein
LFLFQINALEFILISLARKRLIALFSSTDRCAKVQFLISKKKLSSKRLRKSCSVLVDTPFKDLKSVLIVLENWMVFPPYKKLRDQ